MRSQIDDFIANAMGQQAEHHLMEYKNAPSFPHVRSVDMGEEAKSSTGAVQDYIDQMLHRRGV